MIDEMGDRNAGLSATCEEGECRSDRVAKVIFLTREVAILVNQTCTFQCLRSMYGTGNTGSRLSRYD